MLDDMYINKMSYQGLIINYQKTCNCKPDWDVRCVCHPMNKTWKNCPVRVNTAYWLLSNEYEIYKMIEKKGGLKGNKTLFKKELKITDKDWEEMLIMEQEEIS
jgi:hypothetical protein